MTSYINTQTKAYPVSRADVAAAYPNKTFAPTDWPPAPFAEVHLTAAVYDGLTQDCAEGAPEQVNGQWRQTWAVTDVSPEVAAQRAADVKAMAWEQIKAHRDQLKAKGVQVSGKWYHSDADSRIQQLGLVMMGASIPAGLQWKTMDGSFVTMTQALAGAIFQSTAASDMTIFAVAEQHRAALNASADPANYNWRTGWPAVFAG